MASARRKGLQTQKFAKKRRKKIIFVAVLIFVVLASAITSAFLFFREGFVQIQAVEVSGPVGINGGQLSIVPADAIQTDIKNDLASSSLYLFPRNTLFFYPKAAITDELLKDYPAISSINFVPSGSFLGFGKNIVLHAYITERSPFALACGNTPVGSPCFYMDESGFVYAPAATFSPGVYVDYYTDPQSGLPPIVPGNPITDPNSFTMAKDIVGFISGMGLNVTTDIVGSDAFGSSDTVVINNGSQSQPTATDTSSTGQASSTSLTEIYFNQNGSVATELNYFSEFWKQQAAATSTLYQYIDMRYGKDIVYKVYTTTTPGKIKNNE